MRQALSGVLGLAVLLVGLPVTRAESKREDLQKVAEQHKEEATKDFVDWDEKTADFDRMRTPDSPAFVILGVAPTEIQQPGTPMGLATALSGFVSGSGVVIPKNLALVVAPFWLYGHPELTALDYQNGGWKNVFRTFTFSLGTKQSDRAEVDALGVSANHADSDLAVGVRSRIYGTGPDQGALCATKVAALKKAAADLAGTQILDQASTVEMVRKAKEKFPGDEQNQEQEIGRLRAVAIKEAKGQDDALAAAQKDLDKKCFDITASTHGWSVDAAGGLDWFFADSLATKANADLRGGAGWLTLARASDALTVAFMARYASRQQTTDWQKLLDGGLRLVYKRKSYALSGEGLARVRLAGPGPDATYKVDVVAECRFGDATWITVTFGKTFDAGQGGSLFSLANLNWAFGKPTL